jgi:hypothetical protein
VVVDFGKPFLSHVLKRGRGSDREADKEDIGLGIGKGAQTVVIFLSGGIEEAEGIRLVADPVDVVKSSCLLNFASLPFGELT